MTRLSGMIVAAGVALASSVAYADDFEPGSYIIPMDTDHQDAGMLRAYGLVYELLRNGVPVRWVIREGKDYGGSDFEADVSDVATGTELTHEYRGGPWVVDASNAEEAETIIEDWIAAYPEVNVHVAEEAFEADVSRYLVVAPTIAMVADGNEDIARDYMLAAGIPDSSLSLDWEDDSPDMLDIEELSGPTEDSHTDGALFDEDGDPVYCQLMSMHWGVGDAEDNPEVVAEVRAFLNNPTHFFAECQAVNAFENLEPHGFFLTPNGFEFGDRPDEVDFYNADSPFGQLDGDFETVGGSEPSYTLPEGDMYKAGDIVMLTAAGTPEGVEDVWMTGFLDGQCEPDEHECGQYGKISYLGGHSYSTDMPMTEHLDAQGTRLFLNSLFEAPCATVSGLPTLAVAVDAPDQTTEPEVTLKLTYVNSSFNTALDAVLVDTLPDGVTFVSASDGGEHDGGVVTWQLGNLGPGESGDLEIEVTLPEFGIYDNAASLDYFVGLTPLALQSNVSQTEYGDEFPEDDTGDGGADGGTGDGDGDGDGDDDDDDEGDGGEAGMSGDDDDDDDDDADDGTGGTGDADGGATHDEAGGSGCGCTSGRSTPGGATWLAIGLLGLLRRRARVVRVAGVASLSLTACGFDSMTEAEERGTDGISGSGDADDDDDDDADDDDDDDDDDDQKFDVGMMGDVFSPPPPAEGCQAIDFLFVIDSSESMKDHQENLVASFPGFAAEIQDAVPAEDWHVMVVDTDGQWGGADCANACATLGSCPDEPAFDCSTPSPALCDITIGAGEVAPYGEGASNVGCLEDDARYIAEGADELESVFSCIAQVGVDGNSEERTAEALVRSIDPSMLEGNACNEGFLRDDAILVVTIITDEPDVMSPDGPGEWGAAIAAAKSDDIEAVVMLGLLPDAGVECADPLEAPRLDELVLGFPKSSRASVCAPDYSPFFADAVDLIVEVCDDFVPPPPEG